MNDASMVLNNHEKLIARYEELRGVSDAAYGAVADDLHKAGFDPYTAFIILCSCGGLDGIEKELVEIERQLPYSYTDPGDPPIDSIL